MGNSEPTLRRLRQALAEVDPHLAPGFAVPGREIRFAPDIDRTLGGGLTCSALHEIAPATPLHLAAATGLAMALAVRSAASAGETLWIATDFAIHETGGPYGPGLDRFGLPAARLVVLRVPRAADALWAMEEALRCRALTAVIVELTGDGPDAALTATRRLSLAAREAQGSTLALLLRHRATAEPSAAATRWQVTAAASQPDAFGGLGPAVFDLALVKNRRGPCGRWLVTWDHHRHVFHETVSFGVAETAFDRPDRAPLRRAG